MNPILLPTTFDATYVAMSFVLSAVGAFVALTAAAGISGRGRPLNYVNLLASGLALGGIGIWSMHFIGMLALRVQMGVGYAMVETLASLVLAVGGSSLALLWVARNPGSTRHLLGSGLVLAVAVCGMHYLGMYGMRFGGFFNWSVGLVGASIAIALVASTAALYLAFTVRGTKARLAASVLMATAVSAMHYTGMAAADFVCTSPTPAKIPAGFAVVSSLELPVLVCLLALGMAFVISVDQIIQRVGPQPKRLVPRAAPR